MHAGGEVYGDAPIRPWQVTRQQRRTHAITRFSTCFIRLTDDGEARQAHANMHLYIYRPALNPQQC